MEIVLLAKVGNVKRAVLAHPARHRVINIDLGDTDGHGYRTKMSPRNHRVPLAESQHHVIDPTNPRGALDDGVEDRLHVRRRAADDAEHLGRCCLMLQRLAQFGIALPSSLNSRTFSMAITAWSAKVLRRAICFSVKGRTSVRRIMIVPIGTPSRSNGVASMVRVPVLSDGCLDSGKLGFKLGSKSWMWIVCRSMTARPTTEPRLIGQFRRRERWHWSVVRHRPKHVTFDKPIDGVISRRTIAQHSPRPHPTPAEYPSASWR